MDVVGDATVFGLISSVITAIIEVIKAWIPQKYKDTNGIVIPRKSGSSIHLPNQAVWPLLSLFLGIGIFYALNYDPLAQLINSATGGMAVGGAATGLFSQGVYRVKNVLGSKTGGNDATSAQNIGPSTLSSETTQEVADDSCTATDS